MKIEIDIKKVLPDFPLEIKYSGDVKSLGIFGASGCGKSMTLKMIAGIEKPDEGFITANGRTLFDSEKKINLIPQERRVGYLFQNYALFPNMTAGQNIAAGLHGSRDEKEARVRELSELFHVEGLLDKLPRELSGGQQQRVAIARMMAPRPELMLFDEPFSALDDFLKEELISELSDLIGHFKAPLIMVSHSKRELKELCGAVALIKDGRIVKEGAALDIL